MTKKIRLIVLDVDGVLTDGTLFIGSDGEEYKGFNTQDGMGIGLARYTGIKTAIITGRKSAAVTKRAAELKIDFVYQGIHDKLAILDEIIEELEITYDEICYIGDDINDLPIMRLVGFPCAPDNAVSIVKENAKYVASATGGNGAVREIIEGILSAQDDLNEVVEDYLAGKVRVVQ